MEGEEMDNPTTIAETVTTPKGRKIAQNEIEDEIDDYIETLNKSDDPPVQEATKRSAPGERVQSGPVPLENIETSQTIKPQTNS